MTIINLLYLTGGVVYALIILYLYERFIRKSDVTIRRQKIKGENGRISNIIDKITPKKKKILSFLKRDKSAT